MACYIHTTKYSGHEKFVKMIKKAGGGWQLKKNAGRERIKM